MTRTGELLALWLMLVPMTMAQVPTDQGLVVVDEKNPAVKDWPLGKGVHSFDLAGSPPAHCLAHDANSQPDAIKPSGKGSLTTHIATTAKEEYRYRHFDGKAHATKAEVFHAEADAALTQERWSSANTLAIVIVFIEPAGGETMPGPRALAEPYMTKVKQLPANVKPEDARVLQLYRDCGTHFVSSAYFIRQVSLTLRMHDVDRVTYENISAHTKGSGTISGVEYGAELTFAQEFSKALKEERVSLEVNKIGSADRAAVADALGNAMRTGTAGPAVAEESLRAALAKRKPGETLKAVTGNAFTAAMKLVETPSVWGYELTSFATLGFPSEPLRAWSAEKLESYQKIKDKQKDVEDVRTSVPRIVNGEDLRAAVLAEPDKDKAELNKMVTSGALSAYLAKLDGLKDKCVAATTNVRQRCSLESVAAPSALALVPEREQQPQLHYELRVNSNRPFVLDERATSTLLFGPGTYNIDLGLTGAPKEPRDAVTKAINRSLNSSGPTDVLLLVRGRYLENWRLRMVGKTFGNKPDNYPKAPEDPTDTTDALADSFPLIFARLPAPFVATTAADEKRQDEGRYRWQWEAGLDGTLLKSVAAQRASRRVAYWPPAPPPKKKKSPWYVKVVATVAGGAVGMLVGMPAPGAIMGPLVVNRMTVAQRSQLVYAEVFCGDILLEVQDKVHPANQPWVYRIAEATWSSGGYGASPPPNTLANGSVNLVTPALLRRPGDPKEIGIPPRCK